MKTTQGGNKELVKMYPNVRVYGADDRIDCMNVKVSPNQPLNLGSLTITPLFTPCHTRGHMCYYVQEGVCVRMQKFVTNFYGFYAYKD